MFRNYGTTTMANGWWMRILNGATFVNMPGGTVQGVGKPNHEASGLTNVGNVSPGLPHGTLTIGNTFNQSSTGVLTVEIGSLSQYDVLLVEGTADLDGILDVRLLGGYVPNVGDSFRVLTFASRSGDFSAFTGLDIGGGIAFEPVYDGTGLNLVVVTLPVADLSVTKSDERDPAPVGVELTYTLVISNAGPDAAEDVVLTDTLPAEFAFVSATSTQGACGEAGGIVTCNLGTVTTSTSSTVEIIVNPGARGIFENSATVSASSFDPVAANDTATEQTEIRLPSQIPSLTLWAAIALSWAFVVLAFVRRRKRGLGVRG